MSCMAWTQSITPHKISHFMKFLFPEIKDKVIYFVDVDDSGRKPALYSTFSVRSSYRSTFLMVANLAKYHSFAFQLYVLQTRLCTLQRSFSSGVSNKMAVVRCHTPECLNSKRPIVLYVCH